MYNLLTPKAYEYNRIEGRPRTVNFDRALKAEIADPLWMLTRQWQFGEFKGEDTGSSIFAKVKMKTSKLTHFSGNNTSLHDISDALPLESQVEGIRPHFDLKMGLQLARYWKKLLASKGLSSYYTSYKASFPLASSTTYGDDHEIHSNAPMKALLDANASKAMDGVAFFEALKYQGIAAANMIPIHSGHIGDQKALNAAGYAFIDWVDELYVMPDSENENWKRNRLEYGFETGIEQPDGTVEALHTEEHAMGVLDWYNFEINSQEATFVKQHKGSQGSQVTELKTTLLTTQARFPGMPASRWWEFEDGQINYGKMDLSEADMGKLLLAQFGLMYSNDWSMIPVRVPVGSLCEVQEIVVTDVFGQKTIVESAGTHELDDTVHKWSMFNLSTKDVDHGAAQLTDNRLLVLATPAKTQESEPIEEVKFVRDEMSNMAWAIESTIPDGLGKGRDGKLAGLAKRKWLAKDLVSQTSKKSGLVYELIASDVPENWIPFVPVKVNEDSVDQIRLQRGKMKRKIAGQIIGEITPQSDLLKTINRQNEYEPCFLREEEVPKTGVAVKTTYQRVRWYNGKIVLWCGRSKISGQGESTSGMQFDKLERFVK